MRNWAGDGFDLPHRQIVRDNYLYAETKADVGLNHFPRRPFFERVNGP